MTDTPDLSKAAMVKNGVDMLEAFDIPVDFALESILGGTLGYAHTAFVQYLNDNGFELAGQALDDLWHRRDEQWWREPDQFDGRYHHGDEHLKDIGLL